MKEDEKEQLKAELKASEEDEIAAYFAMLNEQTLEEYQAGKQEALRQLNTPVITKDDNFDYQIGNWNKDSFPPLKKILKEDSLDLLTDEALKEALKYELNLIDKDSATDRVKTSKIQEKPQNPSHTLSYKQIKQEFVNKYDHDKGFFRRGTPEITLKFKNKPTLPQDLNRNDLRTWYPAYMHEKTHYDHWYYAGQGQACQSSTNAVKADRLTETTASAVEYLCLAQQYTSMRDAGIKTYEADGQQLPIESLLENYPNLKETVLKYGFDASSPKSVRRIVEIASKHWHQEIAPHYFEQHLNAAREGEKVFNKKSWSEKLETLKNEESIYQETSARMLKDVDIGQNTTVDLSHCRDLLDTMTTEEAKGFSNTHLTYQELKQIDDYLTQKGLTTDKEKSNYMSAALKASARRDKARQDTALENILLQYNPQILYADKMEILPSTKSNLRRISTPEGLEYVIPLAAKDETSPSEEKVPVDKLPEDNDKNTLSLNIPPQDRSR